MKIFNNINRIKFTLLGAFLMAGGCTDSLTTDSSTSISGEMVLANTAGLNTVLRSAYQYILMGDRFNGAQEVGSYVGVPGYHLYYDVSGEDILSTQNYGGSVVDGYMFAPTRTQASRAADKIWRNMYLVINEVNIIIDAIPSADGSEAEKNAIRGQCLALRGIAYFHLILNYQQTYALAKDKRGVILRTSSSDPAEKGFSSVKECYGLIVDDLKTAKSLLANFRRDEKWQLNADVAGGYLARAYQVMGEWNDALQEAETVYRRHGTLMTKDEWCGGFCNIDVDEVLWALVNTNVTNNGENTVFSYWYNHDPSYGEGMTDGPIFNFLNLFVDDRYVQLFDANDYRGSKCTKTENVTDADEKPVMFWHRTNNGITEIGNRWAYNKFKYYGDSNGAPLGHNYANYSLMRSSEMLLIMAEAAANIGNPNALSYLNTLQQSRQANLTTTAQKEALLEAVYVERRKELLGEGVTGTYDLLRLQKPLVRYEATENNPGGHFSWGMINLDGYNATAPQPTGSIPSNDYRFICQIPLLEMVNNSAISNADQNPTSGTGN